MRDMQDKEKLLAQFTQTCRYAHVPVVTAAEMRHLEEASGVAPEALMERAGHEIVACVSRYFLLQKTAVLCGPGNNGGDGFVVARLLQARGWPVAVFAEASLSPAALLQRDRLEVPVKSLSAFVPEDHTLVIDALFGTGLSRSLHGAYAAVLKTLHESSSYRGVSIDVASGIASDTGESLAPYPFIPALTIAIGTLKPCHVLVPAREKHGMLELRSLGLPLLGRFSCYPNHPTRWVDDYPWPTASAHKHTRGGAAVITDGSMIGAAVLSAQAARHVGCGLATVFYPADQPHFHLPSGVLGFPYCHFEDVLQELATARYSALSFGAGCMPTSSTAEKALALLQLEKPIVLDAGALTAFANDPTRLPPYTKTRPVVLTPHAGEWRRLLPPVAPKLVQARAAADTFGCTWVFKGADSVIATPDFPMLIQTEASAWLATGGAGDVLGGTIVGLMALGLVPHAAAAMGVGMHSSAAGMAPYGLLAEDIADRYPSVLEALRLWSLKGRPKVF